MALLSPGHFASDYCRKERERYLEREQGLATARQGSAPLYVVTTPGLEDKVQADLDAWRDGRPRARQGKDVRSRLCAHTADPRRPAIKAWSGWG